jgi:hypothetical protein
MVVVTLALKLGTHTFVLGGNVKTKEQAQETLEKMYGNKYEVLDQK